MEYAANKCEIIHFPYTIFSRLDHLQLMLVLLYHLTIIAVSLRYNTTCFVVCWMRCVKYPTAIDRITVSWYIPHPLFQSACSPYTLFMSHCLCLAMLKTVPQRTFLVQKHNLLQVCVCYNFYGVPLITTIFRTYINSIAVAACAKYHGRILIVFQVTEKNISHNLTRNFGFYETCPWPCYLYITSRQAVSFPSLRWDACCIFNHPVQSNKRYKRMMV